MTTPPAPAAPAPENAPSPRKQKAWVQLVLRYRWPLICALQLGLLVGVYFLRPRSVVAPAPADRPAVMKIPEPEPPSILHPGVPDVQRGDDLASEGRWDLALTRYQPASGAHDLPDPVAYRVAVAWEGLGQYDRALDAYRPLAGRSDNPHVQAAARLGQARVWLRLQRPANARTLLSEMLLRGAEPSLRDQPYFGDIHYLSALALTLEAMPAPTKRPVQENEVQSVTTDWPLDRVLGWTTPDKKGAPADLPGADRFQVKRQGTLPEESLVTASLSRVNVAQLFQMLTEGTGLRLEWTDQARQEAESRYACIAVEGLALPDFTRALANSHGLIWTIDNGTLSVKSEGECPPDALAKYRVANARRALRAAVLAHPGHPLATAAFLDLGNLEGNTGNLDEAASWYQRILGEAPRSPVAVVAAFNLGLTRRRQGNFEGARAAFFRVVDQAPGHELAPQAFLWIGRTHLEEGHPEQAVGNLRQSLAFSAGTATEPPAALLLATAHLLTGKPRAAVAILSAHRKVIGGEAYRQTTAFVEMLARYRALPSRRHAEREAGDLLTALLNLRDEPLLGAPGQLLAGDAYCELGLPEQMVAVYRKALPSARGAVADEMACRLAETLQASGKRELAKRQFLVVAGHPGTKWTSQAQFRLAEIALQEENFEECLGWGRKALQVEGAEKSALLRVMGHAFEQQGDFPRAARCFAGQAPE